MGASFAWSLKGKAYAPSPYLHFNRCGGDFGRCSFVPGWAEKAAPAEIASAVRSSGFRSSPFPLV